MSNILDESYYDSDITLLAQGWRWGEGVWRQREYKKKEGDST